MLTPTYLDSTIYSNQWSTYIKNVSKCIQKMSFIQKLELNTQTIKIKFG